MATARAALDRPRPVAAGYRTGRSFGRYVGPVLRYALLIPLALLFLLPVCLIVHHALSTQAALSDFAWEWWPTDPRYQTFRDLFNDDTAPMAIELRNPAIIAAGNLVLQTLFASMARYALARIAVRGRELVFFVILSTLMVPAAVTFVPTYVVVAELGGVSTLWGIVVPGLFNAFATFLFRQFYLDFPVEIEEAGRLDGLGYWGIYWSLLLPNSKGIMVSLGVLSFIYSWNAFLWLLVIGKDATSWTVQVVISTFLTAQTIDLPMLFAAAAVGAAPLVIVFLVMQRYIVEGVKLSGIKG